ncbi:MAG TPA: hypothetical protein ENI85_04975 [Deltaproteobacteria bacterium]|nr:hypothetical protein [Deltaproteobacteria bacterium]
MSQIKTPPASRPPLTLTTLIALALLVLSVGTGCAPQVMRGGEGTENPELGRAALSVKLDREDINYLVADYLKALQASAFWRRIQTRSTRPLMAIWPIQNATSQHIDDELFTLLSSIETALVNTGDVRVVDRAAQEALIQEIGIQHGAAYDPATAQRMGRQLGVQYFVTGKITSVEERLNNQKRVGYSLFLQIIEVETGLIEFQHEVVRYKAIKG